MNTASREEQAKDDRTTVQNDLHCILNCNAEESDKIKIKICGKSVRRNVNVKKNARESDDQEDMLKKGGTGDGCKLTGQSRKTGPKNSSQKGKLSLRRTAGRQGNSKRQTTPAAAQSRVPKEVMKAILGETTLNQSSDFKEPSGQGSLGRKKVGTSLSKPKSNRSHNAGASSEPKLTPGGAEDTSASDKRPTKSKQNAPGLPSSGDNKRTRTRAETMGKKSPIKGCSVYVSRLKLDTNSPSPAGLPNDLPPSGEVPRATQLPIQSDVQDDSTDALNCSGKKTDRSSARRTDGLNVRTEPPPVNAPPNASQDRDDENPRRCPVCEEAFPGEDSGEDMQNHVQKCLRQRFAISIKTRDATGNSDDTSGDEEFARLLQQREEEKLREEMLTESERFFCQICQRELSHMNSTRRAQHMNRCIDTMEAVEPRQDAGNSRPQPLRGSVPDCPICGKHFKTTKQRESHLKKCARQHQVSPQQLIALVRVQEEAGPAPRGEGEGAVGGAMGGATGGATGGAEGTSGAGQTKGASASTGTGHGTGTERLSESAAIVTKRKGSVSARGRRVRRAGTGMSVTVETVSVSGTTGDWSTGARDTGEAGAPDCVGATGVGRGATTGSADAAGSSRAVVPGELPLRSVPSRGRGGRNAARGRGATRGKGRQKHPIHKERAPLDEETQVALALSASLVQHSDVVVPTEGAVGQSATTTMESTKPAGKPGRKRAGKKDSNKEVPLLLRRTEEEHKRVLEARMADIVLPQEDALIWKTPSMKRSKVAGRYKQGSSRKPRTCIGLAQVAALSSQRANDEENCRTARQRSSADKEHTTSQPVPLWSLASAADTDYQETPFYVPGLLPAVTPQKRKPANPVGNASLRDATPRKPSPGEPSQQRSVIEETSQPTSPPFASQDGPTTQALGRTVQILADLAAESAPHPYGQSSDSSLITASGFIPLEEEDDGKDEGEESMVAVNYHQLEILETLSGLVNRGDLSDLHLVVSDGSLVYAHQLMVRLRCPSLAQLIEESPMCDKTKARRLDLQNFSRAAVLCALDFIYAGRLTVTSSLAEEVGQFARRFSLPKLYDSCSKFCSKLDDVKTVPNPGNQMEEADHVSGLHPGKRERLEGDSDEFLPDKGLDELIQSLWDSSDDGGDDDDEDDVDEKGPASPAKCRVSHPVSDTESDAGAKDSAPDDEDLDEIYEFFSTQRQQSRQEKDTKKSSDQKEDASHEDGDEGVADDEEEDKDDDDRKDSSDSASANHRRRSFTILEQLQNSCRPQIQRSTASEDLSPSPITGKNLDKFVTSDKKFQRKNCNENSKDSLTTPSPDVTTPCFVHVRRLSNSLPVSPLKEKQSLLTVGTCLVNQCNLKAGQIKERQQGIAEVDCEHGKMTESFEEPADEGCSILKEIDATLADVGDSVFQSDSENNTDIEMMNVSQTRKFNEQDDEKSQTAKRVSGVQQQPQRLDMEGIDQKKDRSGDSLFRHSSEERDEDSEDKGVESCAKAPLAHTVVPSLVGTEDESLPFIAIGSQPDVQLSESPDERIPSNQRDGSKICAGPDKGTGCCPPEGGNAGIGETRDDEVIDLSQESDEVVVSSRDESSDDSKKTVQDNGNDNASKNKDVSWVVPQTSAPVPSRIQSASNPSQTQQQASGSSPGRQPIVRPQKFTFRRRGNRMNPEEKPIETARWNPTATPAIPSTKDSKSNSSDTFASIAETPAAFRAGASVIRDSSTPMFGHNSGSLFHHLGRTSPKVSPVKEKKGEKMSDLTDKDATSPSKQALEMAPSVVPRRPLDRTSARGAWNTWSPGLKPFTTVDQAGDESPLSPPMPKLTEQAESESDSPCLSGTPVRPTPDCFDADTPELVSSIPPPPLSPSPPPSPTFGSARCLKPKDAAYPLSIPESLDDTIIDERGSKTLKCKRKLQSEDFPEKDGEAPFKRSKGHKAESLTPSVIGTNHLSPSCITDEDDVLLVSNDDEDKNSPLPKTNLEMTRETTGMGDRESWPGQLCVGLSPTRYSPESPSDDEAVVEEDASKPGSPIFSHVASYLDKLPTGPEPSDPCQTSSQSLSPVKSTEDSNSQTFLKKPSKPVPLPRSPRCTEDSGKQIKPNSVPSSQKSASDADSIHSSLVLNDSEDQFAYFGDDGGGYMDDFNLCTDVEVEAEEPNRDERAPERDSQTQMEAMDIQTGGGIISHADKPSATKSSAFRSASRTSKVGHGNVSIRTFSSSDEDVSPRRHASLPASQGGSGEALSKSALMLREEAEEFGCSESFLCELKAGNVDEEAAWGGVWSTGGGPTDQHSKKIAPQVGQQVTATPVAGRKQPMSKETVDELYYPPAPITPMPPYDDMNTPVLKNALKKFGVKPLPKKKARLKLKEIYHHTHQVLEDSDSDTDKSGPITFKLPSTSAKPTAAKLPSRKAAPKNTAPKTAPQGGQKATRNQRSGGQGHREEALVGKPQHPGLESETRGESQSVDSEDSSDESEYGSSRECPEGNDDDDDEEDDDYLEPTQRTCVNLEEAIKVYIKTKPDLYHRILCYEPLELNGFQKDLKNAGIKYSKNKLREFLDYQGISVQVSSGTTNRHVRKPRQAKAK